MESSVYPPPPEGPEGASAYEPSPAPPSTHASHGPRPDYDRTAGEVLRLRWLMWLFFLLLLLLLAPLVAAKFQYAITAAKERAEMDVARENLGQLDLSQMSTAFRLVAKAVGPSVVNIRTHQGRDSGQGSGVIVDADGYIVTNYHVVREVQSAEVLLSDGRRGPATVVGGDPLADVAVLKTELGDLTAVEWGDSDELDVGDMVWAVGSPFGLAESTTFGIVSAKERRGIVGGAIYQEFLQTDAAVNPGNSGGPLVNIEGKVVGINTAIVGHSFQGISFAIPSTLARKTYETIRRDGVVERGYLGVWPVKVPDRTAHRMGIEVNEGVLVRDVFADTPAEQAGFEPGDVILTWDGEEYSDPTLLSRAIAATPIGTEVETEIARPIPSGSKRMTLKVTIAIRPRM